MEIPLGQPALPREQIVQYEEEISMDMSIWFLMGAALVFFMQCGFAMVEAGFTRAKNVGNITMKNLMDFCIGTVAFYILGYNLLWRLAGTRARSWWG